MVYPVIVIPFLPYPAMAVFPFILLKETRFRHDPVFIRHETIHLRQQLELLVLPFYVCYLVAYLLDLLKFKDNDLAYRQIIFEREAYRHEADAAYLQHRKCWAWRKE